MDGDIRRVPGRNIKIGEEEYPCCEVCGKTAASWRYKDSSLNDEAGRPKPNIISWKDDITDTSGTYTKYPEAPVESYFNCHPNAKVAVAKRDIERWERGTTEVMCCGEWLLCDRFTNTCDHCGSDFNMSGQMLAPREQWGEETGEAWFDCYEGDLE